MNDAAELAGTEHQEKYPLHDIHWMYQGNWCCASCGYQWSTEEQCVVATENFLGQK